MWKQRDARFSKKEKGDTEAEKCKKEGKWEEMGAYERGMGGKRGARVYKVRCLVSIIWQCSQQLFTKDHGPSVRSSPAYIHGSVFLQPPNTKSN